MSKVLDDLEKLSVAERVQLVEDLWDSIARSNAEIPFPQWQRDELDRRKEKYAQNPDSVRTWDEIKNDIFRPR